MTPYMNFKLMAEAGERDRLSLSSKLDRVTAERDSLQARLNAADQEKDDLSFQLNDREASRYSWLQAAQAAEKRVEELSLHLAEGHKFVEATYGEAHYGILTVGGRKDIAWNIDDSKAALSASAEPAKSCGACAGCADGCKLDRESPPVERDERAENSERYLFLRDQGLTHEFCTYRRVAVRVEDWAKNLDPDARYNCWSSQELTGAELDTEVDKARAALDKATNQKGEGRDDHIPN